MWRPTMRAGIKKTGRRTKAAKVMGQLKKNIVPSTMMTVTTLPTTFESRSVKACCAPITSLLRRLTSAPVWVRVKKANGICWMWRKTFERMSKMSPSPMTAEMRRSTSAKSASRMASPPASRASPITRSLSFCAIPLSIRARKMSGFTAAITALMTTTGKKTARMRL